MYSGRARCGMFRWVKTPMTPAERSASLVSMPVMRPEATVLITRKPCSVPRTAASAA